MDQTPLLTITFAEVYTSYFALALTIIILFTNGFSVFTRGGWDPETFVSSYL